MSYVQLTAHERYVIYHLKIFKLSLREIARRLGRHHTTISREIKRNGPLRPEWVYWHEAAQQKAQERKRRPRHQRKRSNGVLWNYVQTHLREDWSPEAIAGRLRREHPDDAQMQVSKDTIYRWVYRDAGEGGTLFTCLCHQHKRRRRQRRYGTGRGLIAGRISIHDRPACVANRERYGDWEGDTVEGAKGSGSIATHVERKSRYLIAVKLPNKTAAATTAAIIAAYRRIPKAIRHTITLDNGKEFSRFKEIERALGVKIYFADPYAAWQRGTNENTNGLMRRYFPKGFDFSLVTDKDLAKVAKKINHRPRKCLNYQTSHEVLAELRCGALGM